MARTDTPPEHRCSKNAYWLSIMSSDAVRADTDLDGVEETELATKRRVEVVVPELERLERVHDRTIVAVGRRRDQAGERAA